MPIHQHVASDASIQCTCSFRPHCSCCWSCCPPLLLLLHTSPPAAPPAATVPAVVPALPPAAAVPAAAPSASAAGVAVPSEDLSGCFGSCIVMGHATTCALLTLSVGACLPHVLQPAALAGPSKPMLIDTHGLFLSQCLLDACVEQTSRP